MLPLRDHTPSSKFPFVTLTLIIINVIVFILEMAALSSSSFIATWALIPSQVDFANPATLLPFITSLFLHAGIAHILFNMWYLWIFGNNLEAYLGKFGFTIFYLSAGAAAGLIQYFFLLGSSIPMLGASGAVAGVLGAYWALFPRNQIDTLLPIFIIWTRVRLPASIVLVFWFITQLFNGVGSLATGSAATGGVAWWAHIGGFAFGWLVAKLLSKVRPPREQVITPQPVDLWR